MEQGKKKKHKPVAVCSVIKTFLICDFISY